MKILYLSHGEHPTGGYYLERELCRALGPFKEQRFARNYRGFWAWCRLFVRAFFAAKSDVVVTVARLAWPVYLRNMFNRSQIILVVHNYDRADGKPALYYQLLNRFLNLLAQKKDKIALVVVADHWKKYFQERWHIGDNIFVFPNTFDTAHLAKFAQGQGAKNKEVHFGQYSAKADLDFYKKLKSELGGLGYSCYFSSQIPMEVQGFDVVYFPTHNAYLQRMAGAHCTVIVNRVNEAWNRLAHESFLVGSQVVCNGLGGTAELMALGNGYVANTVEEVLQIVGAETFKTIDSKTLETLDIAKAEAFARPIKNWLHFS
jgi:hypothetical protein